MTQQFQNLAGKQFPDTAIINELGSAGIRVREYAEERHGEVRTRIYGELTIGSETLIFQRAWIYWSVRGKVPLALANILYENSIGKTDIQVSGHCACPPPKDFVKYFDDNGFEYIADPTGSTRNFITEYRIKIVEPIILADSIPPHAKPYIFTYSIHSQEGLNLFAEMLMEYRS